MNFIDLIHDEWVERRTGTYNFYTFVKNIMKFLLYFSMASVGLISCYFRLIFHFFIYNITKTLDCVFVKLLAKFVLFLLIGKHHADNINGIHKLRIPSL